MKRPFREDKRRFNYELKGETERAAVQGHRMQLYKINSVRQEVKRRVPQKDNNKSQIAGQIDRWMEHFEETKPTSFIIFT